MRMLEKEKNGVDCDGCQGRNCFSVYLGLPHFDQQIWQLGILITILKKVHERIHFSPVFLVGLPYRAPA